MLNPEISEFLADFRRGTHAVVFYDTQENKHDLLFNHLKCGAQNQGLAYVCSEESPKQIREGMKKFGLNTDELKARDQLTISNYDDVYIVDGQVDVPKIASSFSSLCQKYRSMGLEGMRCSAEMSCFFTHGMVKELMIYEYAMHRKLAFPAEGICAYNISEISRSGHLEIIMPMVRAHDPVIFLGPKESLILQPEKVEDTDVTNIMKIKA